jgi:hypothetical protein
LYILESKNDNPVYKAIEEEHAKYVKVQRAGANLPYGPAVPKFQAMLDTLATQDVGMQNKKQMQELADKIFAMEAQEVQLWVEGVWTDNMYDSTKGRIVIAMKALPERMLLIRSMQQIGMVHKADVAPPGYMEDRLSQLIETLELAEI